MPFAIARKTAGRAAISLMFADYFHTLRHAHYVVFAADAAADFQYTAAEYALHIDISFAAFDFRRYAATPAFRYALLLRHVEPCHFTLSDDMPARCFCCYCYILLLR